MQKSSFFNAELAEGQQDRVYLAEDFARYFSSFIGNGVFPSPSTNLQALALNEDMSVTVKAGKAWINGYFYENTDDYILAVDNADGVLNRIDRVVVQLSHINREITLQVLRGIPATTPVAPTLTRNADVYELCIAELRVDKGITQITQAGITDTRLDTGVCGIVTWVTWVRRQMTWHTTPLTGSYFRQTAGPEVDFSRMKQDLRQV